jgi:hypothetical protein
MSSWRWGKAASVPLFNDAAAELPPARNLEGFDLVGFRVAKVSEGCSRRVCRLGGRICSRLRSSTTTLMTMQLGAPAKWARKNLWGCSRPWRFSSTATMRLI